MAGFALMWLQKYFCLMKEALFPDTMTSRSPFSLETATLPLHHLPTYW